MPCPTWKIVPGEFRRGQAEQGRRGSSLSIPFGVSKFKT